MSDKVSVIIPCLWNKPEFINMTFNCVKTMGDVGQILIVANDASFAENVNVGLKAATGDYLVICNNDLEFIQADWLDHLLQPLKDGCDISSIRTTDADGWTTENRYEYNAKFGSLWAMTRETFNKLGYLDESFGRGYFEDLDYWRRAQDSGLKIGKNHAGLVEHKGAETFKTFGKDLLKMQYSAMLKYAEKYPDSTYLIPKGEGVMLIDKYDVSDMTDQEIAKTRELSLTIEEFGRLLDAS